MITCLKKCMIMGVMALSVLGLQQTVQACELKTNTRSSYQVPVVLFSTPWCPYCKQAKAFMDETGINYTECDLEDSELAQQRYHEIQGQVVPTFVIEDEIIEGFDPHVLMDVMAQKQPELSL